MVAQGAGDKPVMDEMIIVGDIGVDAKAGSIDEIAVIDPDDVKGLYARKQCILTDMKEVIPCTDRDKGEDIPRTH